MAWGVIVRGLVAAGGAIWRAAKNPTVRREALRAAQRAGSAFSRFTQQARQLCTKTWRAIRGRNISVSPQQLQKKFKHAQDFDIQGNYNPSNAARFQRAIEEHIADSGTKVTRGSYRGQPVKHYVNPQTGLNVVKDASGEFVSGWKLNPAQLKHVLSNGKLGGD